MALALLLAACWAPSASAQSEPAGEPAVLAIKKTVPAVVNINTERIVRRTIQDPYDTLFNQFFGGQVRPQRELRQKLQSLGSGFIIDPAGYIVTNEHVVERAEDMRIHVTLADGKTYEARYVSGDPSVDLAVIKIENAGGTPFSYIDLKDPSPNYLGQTVLALGNPLGYGLSVSRGILSALDRTIVVDETEYKNLIQTDAAINPGNSGGPLIDISGKLMGISSVKMAYTPQGVPTQGMGFGIPVALVRKTVDALLKAPSKEKTAQTAVASTSARKYFGLQVQNLNPDLRDALGYQSGKGVLISDVEERSPAREAGLQRGLVIYRVGQYEVNSSGDLENVLADVTEGTVADFEIGMIRKLRGRTVENLQTVSLIAREP